jgi:hypothetical protein
MLTTALAGDMARCTCKMYQPGRTYCSRHVISWLLFQQARQVAAMREAGF